VGEPTRTNPTVLETLQTYSAAKNPVNLRIAQDFQMFSTSGSPRWGAAQESSTAESKAWHNYHLCHLPSLSFRTGKAREEPALDSHHKLQTARNSMAFRLILKTIRQVRRMAF
jgi:hypothetical protein